MLVFAGLGINQWKTITIELNDTLKNSNKIYLEKYTSPINIAKKYKTKYKIIEVNRDFIETGTTILNEAKKKNITLLSYGDPMIATTHMDLRLRAEKLGIKTKILHNSSIISVLPGETGLHSYKFGRTVSLMNEHKLAPLSVYYAIHNNLVSKLHSLILLEFNNEKNEYLNPKKAIQILSNTEKEQKRNVLTNKSIIIIASRLGSKNQSLKAGQIKELINKKYKEPPHSIIIPGELHFTEEEALKIILKVKNKNLNNNSKKAIAISSQMLKKYIPKTRQTLITIKTLTKESKRYQELLDNAEAYIKDSERFKEKDKIELAILSIGYAEGLLDSLYFLKEINQNGKKNIK